MLKLKLILFYFFFQWCSCLANGCEGDCLANLASAYVSPFSEHIDPVFSGLSSTIQNQFLSNIPADQVQNFLEPIRQKIYDEAHSKIALELNSTSLKGGSNPTDLAPDKLASLVFHVVNSTLNAALSTVSQAIITLESSGLSTLQPPKVVSPPVGDSPPKPSDVPAKPDKPTAPSAPNPPPPKKDPVDSHPSTGTPRVVSTIPTKAPGAPKLPKRMNKILVSRAFSKLSALFPHIGRMNRAVSFIPAHAIYKQVHNHPRTMVPSMIKSFKDKVSIPHLSHVKNAVKRYTARSIKPTPILLSHPPIHFQPVQPRRVITLFQKETRPEARSLLDKTNHEAEIEKTAQKSDNAGDLLQLADSADEKAGHKAIFFHESTQKILSGPEYQIKEDEVQNKLKIVFRDATKNLEARCKQNLNS